MPRERGASAAPAVVVLGGREVSLTIRRSDRARRLRMRMLPAIGLEVVVPHNVSDDDALAFVRREAVWVLRHVERAAPLPQQLAPADGVTIPYLGAALPLRMIAAGPVALVDGALSVPASGGLDAIERWYRGEARRLGKDLAIARAAELGVSFGRLAIKDTSSRWGSCSTKGNINLSWRLVMAPPEIFDYVVAHEVAHLREMNHSPRFWSLVESLCPRYREHRRWLRLHGHELAAWPHVTG